MTDTTEPAEDGPAKKSKLPIFIGLFLFLAGGAGGFYAVSSGMLFGPESTSEMAHDPEDALDLKDIPDIAFVPLEPLLISFGGGQGPNLRFRAQLEVRSPYQAEVEKLLPRVLDVLNSYLRAVDMEDLQNNAALVRLRAQMLRRVQVVASGDRVNDLLIMEFVLN